MTRLFPRFALLALLALPAQAADLAFTTSDGVRLHIIDQGPPTGHTIVFVPGWTMPAWIFQAQINAFARQGYHTVALDPRGQGDSDIAFSGYDQNRRGQDIAELIARLPREPVLLVGWSLGVLDSLAYVAQSGDSRLAGLVLIDNSVGEDPPPVPAAGGRRAPKLPREEQMRRFVAGMFRTSPGPVYLERLTETALRTPPEAAAALASYPVPRTYWRDAVYSTRKPVLYVVRPKFAAQAANLTAHHPAAESYLFESAGHALFVDEPDRFDAVMQSFIKRRVWP